MVLAQIAITGKVYDISNNGCIKGVEIKMKSSGFSSKTDFSGQYILNSNDFAGDSINGFFGNVLYWGNATYASLYDLSGRLIYNYEKGDESFFKMPNKPSGVYLLALFNGSKVTVYKAYSNGSEFSIIDNNANYISSNQSILDTIIVSAKGFETRKIAIESPIMILDIGLLPINAQNLDYLLRIDDFEHFETISANPSRSHLGEVKALKLVYDIRKDILYYVNTPKHK